MQWHQAQPVHWHGKPAASRLGAWERGRPARIGRTERAIARCSGHPPRSQDAAPEWLVCAAPFSVAVLWAGVTSASLVLWAVTGRREWLDACRSSSLLLGAGALAVAAVLVASVWRAEGASLRPSPLTADGEGLVARE